MAESDKEFEEKVRKPWHLMHSLVSVVHDNIVKTNANITGDPPPSSHILFFFLFQFFSINFISSLFV